MNESAEFEQLLNQKAHLEADARDLEEKQRQVEAKAKVLCDKIIQELKNKNMAKQEALNQLQSKVDELEAQLEKISGSIVPEKTGAITCENAEKPQAAEEAPHSYEEEQQSDGDNAIIVTALSQEENWEQDIKKLSF